MRVYLETLGCRLNYAEMTTLSRQLAGAGHELSHAATEADLCVLNTCAVTGEAARQSRQLARQLHRANPAARLIVTGCYATLEGETVAQLPNVELVVGNSRKDDLLSLIDELSATAQPSTLLPPAAPAGARGAADWPGPAQDAAVIPLGSAGPAPLNLRPAGASERTRAYVKVQDGCRNRCTFCIVTVARGDERSRRIADIVAEVRGLHAEGYQEAVLTGVHLGGYGADLGTGLHDLVEALLGHTRIPRLRLSSLEPFDLEPGFFELWRQAAGAGRLMPHLHLPAQSGSDAVLKRMARRNRVADFEALAAAARAAIPGLTLTTDLIAGFPGETEADFAETMAFARRMRFAHMHIFPYSARAGTAAARFADPVPEPERKRRARNLIEIDAELGRSVRAGFVGQIRPVLWESELSERELARAADDLALDARAETAWSGLTDNYLRVLALAPRGAGLHNTITPVRLTRLLGGDLWGERVPAQEGSR
jgi:threonylcarbamoyladenosine tRNA methylthiotransferase MtaB